MNKLQEKILFIRESGKNRIKSINTQDILFIESEGDYVIIHTEKENLMTHSTLKNMMEVIPSSKFVQVHRCFIVRFDKISEIDSNMYFITVQVKNIPKSISVGNSYRQKLKEQMNII